VFKNVEREEDEDYELEKMAAVIKSKGGKMYRKNLDDEDDDDNSTAVRYPGLASNSTKRNLEDRAGIKLFNINIKLKF